MATVLSMPKDMIKDKIYTVRNVQVMLDEDLAILYGVPTKRLNEQVKRNSDRFPIEFCFQLDKQEYENLRSQFVTFDGNGEIISANMVGKSNNLLRSQIATFNKKVGRKYLPYVFTEQGVAMLSAVLKSEVAVKVSISIMNAFISMRRLIADNNQIFMRLDTVERKQLVTDQKIEQVLTALSTHDTIPPQKLFFENNVFDAHVFVSKIIRSANRSIVLIDNFIDETVLHLFTKRNKEVAVTIYTKKISSTLKLDIEKFNSQYPAVEVKSFDKSHDRFLIIDDKIIYHFGASLKDLGKKWFVVTKLDTETLKILERL